MGFFAFASIPPPFHSILSGNVEGFWVSLSGLFWDGKARLLGGNGSGWSGALRASFQSLSEWLLGGFFLWHSSPVVCYT
jgi:hypothetical protein